MKEVKLENFRCYTQQTIKFKSGVNLLIGDNASGKTTLLKACKYILSAFFAGFSDENTKWISPDANDFSDLTQDGIILPERPIKIHFNQEPDLYSTIFDCNDAFYTLQKNSKKNSRALVSGISGYKEYAALLYQQFYSPETNSRVHPLPLFACFSTEDIHSTRKIDASKFIKYAQKSSFGYYECLEGNGFLPYWLKRLLVLQEGQKNTDEIEIVRQALISALGTGGCDIIQDMHIRPNQKKVYYILSDEREVEAEHLSDGYKRLVNIVTDIAFRCALLNKDLFHRESCLYTHGTVLIDEVDLHLHPTLQATVLQGLQNAFPQLQFIVTTHAPMVMTGVEHNADNQVYKLSYSSIDGYQIVETQTYGLDASTMMEVILDQTPRAAKVEEELCQLFNLIDEEKEGEARELLTQLQSRFGNTLPELAEAEAMLNFTMEDDEADH